MAPKILLADDSMTAQNMGRKILAEGGYDVVAVSNGAAALKKIAEVHPELVILDVYMPGYTGLEVCERVRGALATAHLPVVLTVGKLEPFKPEEGNRVKADALLVKPFEATDLLATVKKLLEKSAAPARPDYEDKVRLEAPPTAGFSDASYEAWKTETPAEYEDTREVPQEIAAAPAIGQPLETPSAPEPPLAMAAAAAAAVPAFSVEPEPAMPEFAAAPAPVFDLDLHLDEPEAAVPAPAESAETAPATADSILDALVPELEMSASTPAPEHVETAPDIEFTAAPQAQDVVAEPLPDLEPTVLQDAIPVEVASDSDLVTTPEELAAFTTSFGVENPEEVSVGLVADLPPEQAEAISMPDPLLEVAAAEEMATPAPATPEAPVEVAPEPIVEEAGAAELDVLVAEPAPEPTPVELTPAQPEPLAEATAVIEPAPAVPEAAHAEPASARQDISLEEELQRAFADVPPAEPAEPAPAKLASVAEVPIPEASAATPAGEDAIVRLVERLIERLKPELVAAIVKELKG